MRLSLRFIIPLVIALAVIAYAVVPLVDQLTVKWFVRDLDMRSALISNTIQDQIQEFIRNGTQAKLVPFFTKITQDERLYAVGFCDSSQRLLATQTYPQDLACAQLDGVLASGNPLLSSVNGPLHVSIHKIEGDGEILGRLVLVHDMSFIQRRTNETKRYLYFLFIGIVTIVSLITVIIAQLSWRGWIQGARALLRGEGLLRPAVKVNLPELRPLARDLRVLLRDLKAEHRPRDESQVTWSPEALKRILHEDLRGEDVIVVSNREPYIHVRHETIVEVQRPASGLVTALEPVMRACSGVWIAHGSGSADLEVADRNGHVAVPPENPAYQLRRLWLSKEEELGYYYGFANEGLWPLCHIAHVRPTFRSGDWNHYAAVNRKFARAVREESKTDEPIVIVQDYHFALLPRMIREMLPLATIITFWHIPWPNPEAFAICPWRAELLDGLLGSSILGFHTQFHCNNFLDTVDRHLEARVDRELFTVHYRGQPTAVNRYPISIEWPPSAELLKRSTEECRHSVHLRHRLPQSCAVGIGVDRLDYTKGIIERFNAIERLLEMEPGLLGKFCFIQIAAPSRSSIEQYQQLEVQVRTLANRINTRFAASDFPPILLKVEHHDPHEVYEYYRAADICCVSSLHDGMNLVAKEYIASHEDERGVLILSQFAGASRELPEALIVNPYDVDQCAAAFHLALTMSPSEQRDRMRIMRGLIQEFNVYRWAGRMLLDAANMRRRRHLIVSNEKAQRHESPE